MRHWLHTFVNLGLAVPLVAVALLHACASALGGTLGWRATLTVAAGTLAVYAFDRRLDDHVDRPDREDSARRHQRFLVGLSVAAAAVAVWAGLGLGREPVLLLGSVVALALVHAWLRRLPWIKPAYIAVAWVAVVVGLPGLLLEVSAGRLVAELLPIGLSIVANVIACDAIDREAEAAWLGPRRAWWVARMLAWAGVVTAVVSTTASALAAVPACLAVALIPYRAEPNYVGMLDAAIGVGALGSILWMSL